MSQANMDLGIFQETKLTKRIYTRESAPSAHSGGVTVFYRAAKHFYVEAIQTYGENVISFQLESVYRRWYIVGCYLAPDDASNIEDVVAAIGKRLQGAALLVVGDFKKNLAASEGKDRYEGITAALAEENLEEMSSHFLPRYKPCLKDGHT